MPEPVMLQGRSAWTTRGHDHGGRYYQFKVLATMDGKRPTLDMDHLAVHHATRAYQQVIVDDGYRGRLDVTGIFGPRSKWGTQWYQAKHGINDDGEIGPATSAVMVRPLVERYSTGLLGVEVPPDLIWGTTKYESYNFDFGAVSSLYDQAKGPDWGIGQVNQGAHPVGPIAFSPHFALMFMVPRTAAALQRFDGKGPALQRECTILQHNSPKAAQIRFEVGSDGADTDASKYIARVEAAADTYPGDG